MTGISFYRTQLAFCAQLLFIFAPPQLPFSFSPISTCFWVCQLTPHARSRKTYCSQYVSPHTASPSAQTCIRVTLLKQRSRIPWPKKNADRCMGSLLHAPLHLITPTNPKTRHKAHDTSHPSLALSAHVRCVLALTNNHEHPHGPERRPDHRDCFLRAGWPLSCLSQFFRAKTTQLPTREAQDGREFREAMRGY